MNPEQNLGSSRYAHVRMFDAPVGPCTEAGEDPSAPFYVPRRHTPPSDQYQYDSRMEELRGPIHVPPFGDDRDDRRHWRSEVPQDIRGPGFDREYREDDSNLYSARHVPRDRKRSDYPYSKQQPRHRDHSRERYSPNVSKPRKHNSNAQPSHRRRASSKVRHNCLESSVSNISQHHRQPSHDDITPQYPHSRADMSPQSSYPETFPSSPHLPISPISNPSVAGRSWNGTPPHAMKEDTNTPQALLILNHMLQRQSVEQIIRCWKATGQGPNPYEYPLWEGWYCDAGPRPLNPRGPH